MTVSIAANQRYMTRTMSRPAFAGSTPNDADEVIIAFIRISRATGRKLVCVCQFLPVVRTSHRVGVPASGLYDEILNGDSTLCGGSNQGNAGAVVAAQVPWHGLPYSLSLTLPPWPRSGWKFGSPENSNLHVVIEPVRRNCSASPLTETIEGTALCVPALRRPSQNSRLFDPFWTFSVVGTANKKPG
jgi:hypothetical protein